MTASPLPEGQSEDALLGGRVRLRQPVTGYRVAIDPVFLAAAVPAVPGDRVHLQQVMLNLILNAMDAMEGCPVADRMLMIRAGPAREGGIEIAVSDCGTGIPADKMKLLFEPFFTTKPAGMGMGLAISRTIIEAHNGKIVAENNAGKGATFRFTLPANGK